MGLKEWWANVTGTRPPEPPAPTVPQAPTEDDIMAALDRVVAMVSGGAVPAPVASRVRRVATTVRETMPRLRNVGLGSAQAYSVMATATDYLPEAINGYLRLPRQWADSRPIENGKSALLLLVDQLDLLGSTMDKVLDAVLRTDADALIAHGRFLAEKFGSASSGGQLDLAAGQTPPTAPPTAQPDKPASTLDLP